MTNLWVLRHDGAVIACAPEGCWHIALITARNSHSISHATVNAFRDMRNALTTSTRYEFNGYTLALEPHPTPGAP